MRALGNQVEGLEATVQEGMEDSSRELATEVVEFTLASLWSRFPILAVEEVMQGIISGDEACARDHVRHLVGTFTAEAGGAPPTEGNDLEVSATAAEESESSGASQ